MSARVTRPYATSRLATPTCSELHCSINAKIKRVFGFGDGSGRLVGLMRNERYRNKCKKNERKHLQWNFVHLIYPKKLSETAEFE